MIFEVTGALFCLLTFCFMEQLIILYIQTDFSVEKFFKVHLARGQMLATEL